jgi:hypothetical protein
MIIKVSLILFILEAKPIENIQTRLVPVYQSASGSDGHSHTLLHTVTKVTNCMRECVEVDE